MKTIRRPKRFSLAWYRRQRLERERARAAAAASGPFAPPPKLSNGSKRELDELLRDLGGEG